MILLILVIIGLVIAVIAEEGATISTYGGYLSDAFLKRVLEKNLEKYTSLNPFDKNIISSYPEKAPYIAKGTGVFARWHIKDMGIIPRWSKYSKVLDAKWEDLLINQ